MQIQRSLMRCRAERGGAMAGCLIALGIVLVIVIAGVIFVALNWRGWMASGIDAVSEGIVAEMELDETERGEVLAELKAVTQAFKDGDIELSDAGRIIEEIARSPVAPTLIVAGLNAEYFQPSGLEAEEKEAANLAMSRVARGVYDKSIEPEKLNEIFAPISTTATTGSGVHINTEEFSLNLKSPDDVTDEELREVIVLAQAEADAAEVPNEEFEIDASEEIAKAVETALGRRLTPAPEDRP